MQTAVIVIDTPGAFQNVLGTFRNVITHGGVRPEVVLTSPDVPPEGPGLPFRQQCGSSAEAVRKQCGSSAEKLRKQCGGNAERLRR